MNFKWKHSSLGLSLRPSFDTPYFPLISNDANSEFWISTFLAEKLCPCCVDISSGKTHVVQWKVDIVKSSFFIRRSLEDWRLIVLDYFCLGNLHLLIRLRNESLVDHQLVLVIDSLCLHGFRFLKMKSLLPAIVTALFSQAYVRSDRNEL